MALHSPKKAEENPLALRDLPMPVPGDCEIRVRIAACGVCHTDLHIVEGDLKLPKLPVVPGHQIVGVVDAAGAGTRRFREGDRVGIPWLHSTCGQCRFCREGLENLCAKARFTGFHVDGGYAEATIVHEDFAYPLPDNFSDVQAAPLLCAGIIGYRSLRLSGVEHGGRLGLFGFGGSAHLVLQLARHRGCEVLVFTRSEEHRALARELGAVWAGSADEMPPDELDGAIIFAPAGKLVPYALRATRKGGTVALAGITMSPIPEMDYDSLLYHERILRSVANSTREDARELLRAAAEIPLRTEVQAFKLEEANAALQALKHSKIRGAAVLVT
jgi:propanol-preferring alcohol dehydrogenase